MNVRAILSALVIGFSTSACFLQDLSKETVQQAIQSQAVELAADSCSAPVLKIFKEKIHTFTTNKCAICHGSNQQPKFAISNSDEAYVVASGYVDLLNPALSKLYLQSKNNHCMAAGCQTTGAEMLAGIQEWAVADQEMRACMDRKNAGSNPTTPGSSPSPSASTVPTVPGIAIREGGMIKTSLTTNQLIGACVPYEVVYATGSSLSFPSMSITPVLSGMPAYSANTCLAALASPITFNSTVNSKVIYLKDTVAGTKTLNITAENKTITFRITFGAAPSPTPSVSPTPAATPCSTAQKQNAFAQTAWVYVKDKCMGCHASGSLPQFANATLTTAYPVALSKVNVNSVASSVLYVRSGDGHCGSSVCTGSAQAALMAAQLNQWFPAETTTNCSALTTPH